jgi:hypothetical protein
MESEEKAERSSLFAAAEKMRRAVLGIDKALTELIGTEAYPGGLTEVHVNLRDCALLYDDAKRKAGC